MHTIVTAPRYLHTIQSPRFRKPPLFVPDVILEVNDQIPCHRPEHDRWRTQMQELLLNEMPSCTMHDLCYSATLQPTFHHLCYSSFQLLCALYTHSIKALANLFIPSHLVPLIRAHHTLTSAVLPQGYAEPAPLPLLLQPYSHPPDPSYVLDSHCFRSHCCSRCR